MESARLVAAGRPDVDVAPPLLRDVIRFGHAERGLPTRVTDEALDVVDEFEDVYREQVEEWRRQFADHGRG